MTRLPHDVAVNLIAVKVRGALREAGVTPGAGLLVACSGGPDSMCLADVVTGLSTLARLGPITLATIDHGLRPAARQEARLVAELAERLEVGFVLRKVLVKATGQGLMAAARHARYRALGDLAREHRCAFVLTGHTADDQAETFLMRLLRGDGSFMTLAGIKPRLGRFVRPMLQVRRRDIERYGALRGLVVAQDPTNQDPRFMRSVVRHQVLPQLVALRPDIVERLSSLARSVADGRSVIEAAQFGGAPLPQGDGVGLDAAWLRGLTIDLGSQVAEDVARRLGVELPPAARRRLFAMAQQGQRGQVSGTGLEIHGPAERAVVRKVIPAPARTRALVTVDQPGVRVRVCRPGDRFRPPRLLGRSSKLVDLYAQAGVPAALRRTALVAESITDGLVWAEHLGHAWGQPGTSLQISLVRLP